MTLAYRERLLLHFSRVGRLDSAHHVTDRHIAGGEALAWLAAPSTHYGPVRLLTRVHVLPDA